MPVALQVIVSSFYFYFRDNKKTSVGLCDQYSHCLVDTTFTPQGYRHQLSYLLTVCVNQSGTSSSWNIVTPSLASYLPVIHGTISCRLLCLLVVTLVWWLNHQGVIGEPEDYSVGSVSPLVVVYSKFNIIQ